MRLIRHHAYARAGLVGNPSDGYHGKTLSVVVPAFRALVTMYEWDEIDIVLSQEDRCRFRNVDELHRDVLTHGYYGGVRLVKATVKKFVEFCRQQGLPLSDDTFALRYESNIPRQVGLAGSSAIIVATLRCLMEFYGIDIPRPAQPSLVLSVEMEELGITAGLQDRVIQVYGGAVYMDFSEANIRTICGLKCGRYEPLDVATLPPLYVSYKADAGEPTEVTHNDLRGRYNAGDRAVQAAMRQFAELTDRGRAAILAGDAEELGRVIDANFDLRRSIMKIPRAQVEMVDVARAAGATAKFAGSGGAIIGTYGGDDAVFERLRVALGRIGCETLKLPL